MYARVSICVGACVCMYMYIFSFHRCSSEQNVSNTVNNSVISFAAAVTSCSFYGAQCCVSGRHLANEVNV